MATRDTTLLSRFLLITYADLKKYKYYYWFAFPAFVSKPAWEITADGWKGAAEAFSPDSVRFLSRLTPMQAISCKLPSSARLHS